MGSSDSNRRPEKDLISCTPLYVRELVAGGASGAIAKTVIAPLERIKILLQTRTEGFHSIGVGQSLRKIIKHEGVQGLYKGNGANVLRSVPYSAIHYMTYEQYRCWLLENCPSIGTGPVVDLLAGSVAGGTGVLCTYPLDLVRTKLAYQVVNWRERYMNGLRYGDTRPPFRGIQDVFRVVYKEGGVRAFYRGVGPTLIGILPYAGLKFYIYEELKLQLPDEHKSSIVMGLSCGAVAGLLGQTITYPLDVVRRQMQVEILRKGETRYRNTMEALACIIRNQGWRQLYAGLSINYMKVIPSVAIGFTAYDVMKAWLQLPSQQNS